MLACTSCGRAWNARVLDPVWLTSATCPGCGGELHVRSHTRRRIAAQPPIGRFTRQAPTTPLKQRLSGLGG